MLFPVFWVQQRVQLSDNVTAELRAVRAILDWGATVCAGVCLVFAILVAIIATCCNKKPATQYIPPHDLIFQKPKDEAEIKLNPL